MTATGPHAEPKVKRARVARWDGTGEATAEALGTRDPALAELLVQEATRLASRRWGADLNVRRVRARLTRILRERPDLGSRADVADWRPLIRRRLEALRPPDSSAGSEA